MPEEKQNPRIIWDHGTAWDLFASLYVIFTPSDYGLRASWAAGVRSRLSSGARETLGTMMRLHMVPLPWLHGLDEPKTARVALDVLEALPAEEILPAIALNPRAPESHDDLLRAMVKRGSWTAAERSQVFESWRICNEKAGGLSAKDVDAWIDAWEHAREFGSSLRIGIREFYEVFFRDEERRIAADLEHALVNARTLAERLAPRELFEELSQGIRNDALLAKESLVLVPCYWCSPRIIYGDLAPDTNIVLFGARPADASLIPGDTVPARLLLAMEAL